MRIYLVTVIVGSGLRHRYFDSIWVRKDHAEERVVQLRSELRRSGISVEVDGVPTGDRWAVTSTTAFAADGQLADEQALPDGGEPQATKEETR